MEGRRARAGQPWPFRSRRLAEHATAKRWQVMGLLSGFVGPRKETIKREVAGQFGGALVRTPPGHTVVVSKVDGWSVVFDINSPEAGPAPIFFGPRSVTRIGIPFVAQDNFVWDIKRRGLTGQQIYKRRATWVNREGKSWEQEFQEIQPHLKTPDIAFGFGDFDYEFTIDTNDEGKLGELLAKADFREFVQEQQPLHLRVEQEENGWLASLVELPYDVAVLFFQDLVTMKDVGRIQGVHELLRATMKRLVAIGSASPVSPKLTW